MMRCEHCGTQTTHTITLAVCGPCRDMLRRFDESGRKATRPVSILARLCAALAYLLDSLRALCPASRRDERRVRLAEKVLDAARKGGGA